VHFATSFWVVSYRIILRFSCATGGYSGGFYYADLWRFTRHARQWVRLSDSGVNAAPVRGIRREASAAVTPGGRLNACSAVDELGRLWLYAGGSSYWWRGEVFMFSVNTTLWSWMAGSPTDGVRAVYTQGRGIPVSGASAGPGGREAHTW
jgi:hypothetical protein